MLNEIQIHTTKEGCDLVSALLMELGANGTQVIDRSDVPDPNKPGTYWELYDPKMVEAMPEDVIVKAWFAPDFPISKVQTTMDTLRDCGIGMDMGTLKVESGSIPEENWGEKWKQGFKPFLVGRHFWIKPTWAECKAAPEDKIIELDPGMAFGTGTHETTNMCLQLLEKYMKKGMQVMDVGTGSGILAIGAALLGAGNVLAVDIDPEAVKVAEENIRMNHVEAAVTVRVGDLCKDAAIPCDLAVANIVADAVCMLMEPLRRNLKPAGLLLCSGIMKTREEDVLAQGKRMGYTVLEKLEMGEWVALAFRKDE